jgi:hypothetical protein
MIVIATSISPASAIAASRNATVRGRPHEFECNILFIGHTSYFDFSSEHGLSPSFFNHLRAIT